MLETIHRVIAQGPYQPRWPSLQQVPVPAWYRDARFGIFIHWGVYSVPAFGNEWYPRNMYIQGTPEFDHHVATYGPQAQFGYKDFIPLFKAERFDPDQWADLFKRSGARYVVPVAEHHDGFAMYNCSFSRWTAAHMGPQRDVLGDLAAAVRRQGLVFGVSSHRAEHWWFMNGGMAFDSDVRDPRYHDFYGPAVPITSEDWQSRDWTPRPDAVYLDDWLARTCELVDKYRPQLVWFDWWIEQVVFQPYLQKFAAYYYNRAAEWNLEVAINFKHEAFPEGAAIFDVERGQLQGIRPTLWQTDTAVSKNSWGYITNHDYKSAPDIIGDLVDIVSKNGVLLLNIGPRPDGTIPEAEQQLLLAVGAWLSVNGEAIYATRPWKIFGEGPTEVVAGSFNDAKRQPFTARDIRFTARDNALYAIVLGWPEQGEVIVEALRLDSPHYPGAVRRVSVLGNETPPGWSRDADGLKVQLPGPPPDPPILALKIE